ncbi:MAG: NAD-dependent epimerase/dehydratase family protein [Chloroflexota bacterium]|nr:MAG: NAD-dependent epimerase/dehydratase family protein [Chloroflexota bacterium]
MPLTDRRVLITGGTGSLGRALTRRVLRGDVGRPSRLTIFSRDEAKQHAMRQEYLGSPAAADDAVYRDSRERLTFRIGDVRDARALTAATRDVDVVIHAAALKQVPSCEYFPSEAINTNVFGAMNLVAALAQSRVETVIGISTDKACKPINVMGMTKALQERILIQSNLDLPTTRIMCVRYGNVIASRGSVVPLFADQIARGGPVTVTVAEMTRFLLTLDQAVDTVFAALRSGQPGETYIPRAPSARVVDLAAAMIDGRPIEIAFTGIRPGEKLHEIMVSEEEQFRTASRDGYYVIRPVLPELRPLSDSPKSDLKDEYSSADVTLDVAGLRDLLASSELDLATAAIA